MSSGDSQTRGRPGTESPVDARETLDLIDDNSRAWDAAERSWKRLIPFWLIRRQYRICKENEVLFARLGVVHPPFAFETKRGISWSITRKLIGV